MGYMDSNAENESRCKGMIELAEQFLPLNSWAFHQSDRIISTYPVVVYDSEWCRVQLVWGGWDLYAGYTMSIYYGRLHAPSDKAVIMWKGEECYCWHRVNEALRFLDGLSPQEAVDESRMHGKWPFAMEQFRQSEIGKSLERNQPEWIIRMHGSIWEQYGQRLFELFDLRHPERWEEFRHFLKEFYETEGLNSLIKPPSYQRC
jgi:hypothetical protein